jgi:protein PhnA
MSTDPKCPKCNSEFAYLDGSLWTCPECSHEWSSDDEANEAAASEANDQGVRDANGNVLTTGDTVIVIKDLKVKGASSAVKGGTKVKNIRIVDSNDGHNISCNIDGFGSMYLKSEFVKKA